MEEFIKALYSNTSKRKELYGGDIVLTDTETTTEIKSHEEPEPQKITNPFPHFL